MRTLAAGVASHQRPLPDDRAPDYSAPMPAWTRWIIAAAFTVIGALYLIWKGPVPVVRVFDTLPIDAPFPYMLSAFPVLGLLVADGASLALERRWRHSVELCAQIAIMVLLAHFRLELRIPISGHALLFTAFALRRHWLPEPPSPVRHLEAGLGWALLAVVAGIKLLWWHDPTTLAVGVVTGVGLTWAGRRWLGLQAAQLS